MAMASANRSLVLLRKMLRNKSILFGLIVVSALVLMAVLADRLMPHDPLKIDLEKRLQPPSSEHLLGADSLGRDILSRIILGSRVSLGIALGVVLLSLTVGIILGTFSGYFMGSWLDEAVMRVMDILMVFPGVLLAMVLLGVTGPGFLNLTIAIGVASIAPFTRVVRGGVISVKENMYVEAARAVGESTQSIILRTILPNALAPILTYATLRMGVAVLYASTLSFLGLGIQPPNPEWGIMVSDGREFLRVAPHVSTFPGLVISMAVLGFNILGDGLNDFFNPRVRERRG